MNIAFVLSAEGMTAIEVHEYGRRLDGVDVEGVDQRREFAARSGEVV